MTVRVNKSSFNIREKLSELAVKFGLKGSELMRAETAQDARDLVSAGRRNLIINGNFDFWQRATSTTGALSNAYGSADRWMFNTRSCTTRNISQQSFTTGQSDVPGNPAYFLRGEFSNNSGSTGAFIMQRIEDVRVGAGQFVTVSFYAKANSGGGTVEVALSQQFVSVSTSTDNTMGSFTPTSEWKKYYFTTSLPSISGKTVGSNSYLRLDFRMPPNTAITFDVARVQLEVGKNATDFEHRSYGEELALCQRYFQLVPLANGLVATTTQVHGNYSLMTDLRAMPTVGLQGPIQVNDNGVNVTQSSAVIIAYGTGKIRFIQMNNFSGLTLHRPVFMRFQANNNLITLSAEL